ncbi:putative tubulin--tyrosine ligase pby1 [Rhizina undulata]
MAIFSPSSSFNVSLVTDKPQLVKVTNDDGPPSQVSSPYVHSFVSELQKAGVTVSVVLPHTQRSWIGKAHLAGRTVTPTYFRPGTLHTDDGTTHSRPRSDSGEDWVLVDGTPASCVQIGLYHYFQDKGPIDMVISGPNYGRNTTAVFSLSSGTIGGALEGAVCGKRSIALSYAFHNRNHDPVIIKGASEIAVKLIQHLHENWTSGVELYSINIPLIEGINKPETKILYTNILQNSWTGSSFEEMPAEEEEESAEVKEMVIREGQEGMKSVEKKGLKHRKFKWAPKFVDVFRSVELAPPGNDGWAVKEGHVSVTPMRANFMHFESLQGELQLSKSLSTLTLSPSLKTPITAFVNYEDAYVQPRIISALRKHLPNLTIITSPPSQTSNPLLTWASYEKLPFEQIMSNPNSTLACSYIIRKALIRKHHLSHTINHHVTKNPSSALSKAFPTTCDFELDYAEYLDEALVEAYELRESLEVNESKTPRERKYWILKPGMSDRAQGIRIFSTMSELESIFEEFDMEPDSDEEEAEETGANVEEKMGTEVMASQLRFWIAQKYLQRPLLLGDRRKFHIRTYVLAVGGLRVYVYKEMLALFAGREYVHPWEDREDLGGHLTNTCLQSGEREGSVRLFWGLEIDGEGLERIWTGIREAVAETFRGAAEGMRVHFQTLPNAFEVFGLDFILDEDRNVYLLEVNSYPDFKQTGKELSGLIDGLFENVVEVAVKPFFEDAAKVHEGTEKMVKALDLELGKW